MFCPECGTDHHAGDVIEDESPVTVVDNTVTPAEVEIARINAERDIKLARIAAGMQDAERDEQLARAEGKADALEQIVTPPEPDPEPDPVVIDAPPVDDTPDDAPPPTEGSPAPEPHNRSRGMGVW